MAGGMGEFAAWPPAAVATVVAAAFTVAFTVVLAVPCGLWAGLRSRRDVAREERDRAWSRFVWTVDHACAEDVGRAGVGSLGAEAMYDMRSRRGDGARLGTMVLGLITGEETA